MKEEEITVEKKEEKEVTIGTVNRQAGPRRKGSRDEPGECYRSEAKNES